MDIDFGQILPNPTDAPFDPAHEYGSMDTCLDDYQSEWLSLVGGNKGHALPGYYADGRAKKDQYWRCLLNLHRTGAAALNAEEKAALANEKANLANEKAELANQKAANAQTQADYAKNMADHPNYIGNDGYYYAWSYATQSYIKGEYMKGEGIDYSTMSAAEKQELVEAVAAAVEQEGGYLLYPVDINGISTTTVFQKNSIISIDGVVYRAKQDTYNLPVTLVVDNNKFVTQVLYGHTVFIKANNSISSDWDIWLDASNDFRYKEIEARVAKLETIINSL